jgi:hypothetical protein
VGVAAGPHHGEGLHGDADAANLSSRQSLRRVVSKILNRSRFCHIRLIHMILMTHVHTMRMMRMMRMIHMSHTTYFAET